MRRILFFTPLILLATIVGLSFLPGEEELAWREASRNLAWETDPPAFLAGSRWTRSGTSGQCGDYWVRYRPGEFVQNFPSHQYSAKARYRTKDPYFEVQKGRAKEYLKREGERLIVYEANFARPLITVGLLYQERCE